MNLNRTVYRVYHYNTTSYDQRGIFSAMVNLTYSYRKSKISWKNFFNNDFNKNVSLRTGLNTVNPGYSFNYKGESNEAAANGIGSSVLEGMHSPQKRLDNKLERIL